MRDIQFIISTGHKGWVLHHLALEVQKELQVKKSKIIEMPQSRRDLRSLEGYIYLKRAYTNFYMHQDLALHSLKKGWLNKAQINIVNYTHTNKDLVNYREMFESVNYILVQNQKTKNSIENYLKKSLETILVLPNPIDFERFSYRKGHKTRDVVFVSNFYSRKQPDLIFNTIKNNKDLKFSIIGKNWNSYWNLDELLRCKNLQIIQFDYTSYPEFLAKHKVFCSLSKIEGGPVPLLEALSIGLIPVVTDTGTARDLMPKELTDLILPTNVTVDVVTKALRKAITRESKKLNLDVKYSFAGFSNILKDLMY